MSYKISLSLLPGAFTASEEYIEELASEGKSPACLNQVVIKWQKEDEKPNVYMLPESFLMEDITAEEEETVNLPKDLFKAVKEHYRKDKHV